MDESGGAERGSVQTKQSAQVRGNPTPPSPCLSDPLKDNAATAGVQHNLA